MPRQLVTIERFLLDRQPEHATGAFTSLLYDLALAGKLVSSRTRQAGLTELLGKSGATNVQGEEQAEFDVYADEVFEGLLARGGRVCALVSEEQPDLIELPDGVEPGPYVVAYDPLDGSSNIDSNVSIGTIFGVFRARETGRRGHLDDALRPGRDLVAAGYILYGTSTMLVYSAGEGVHAFTLDPEVGEFLLTWSDMRFPEAPKYYSFNHGSYNHWKPEIGGYLAWLRDEDRDLTQRYIGSAVADFHRNLIHGGVFGYPAEAGQPDGKLRLLYEAAPLAFLAEQAGGYGSDGERSILDIEPTDLHQRTPVFIGDRELVRTLEQFVAGDHPAVGTMLDE